MEGGSLKFQGNNQYNNNNVHLSCAHQRPDQCRLIKSQTTGMMICTPEGRMLSTARQNVASFLRTYKSSHPKRQVSAWL